MQTFKRFILYISGIVLLVVLLSAAFIVPWLHTPVDLHDQALRQKLAGQIDTFIIGQSYSMNGIVPAKLDEKLGTVSYNLSGSLMPVYGQKYMIEKELKRNPVKHIILEITPDTFTTNERETNGNGDSFIVTRLSSLSEQIEYLVRCVPLSDWPNIYARTLLLSMRSAAYRLLGRAELIDEANMGFNPLKAEDVSLPPDVARSQFVAMSIFHNPLEENIREYEELITLCKQDGCDVTIVYPLVSHGKVWQLYDHDLFREWSVALAEKHDVPLFDFNLLKSRYDLFSDATSFSDENHLCREGAEIFSEVMADVLARHRAGEDVSSLFYDNYEEMIYQSVYMQK